MLNNWRTSLLGGLTCLGAVIKIILSLQQGVSIVVEDLALLAGGTGLIAAKDHNK